MSGKKKYDLICSLGAMCAAAWNIKKRNLRPFSLPFDWCYIKNSKPIEYLCEGFENNFEKLLLKENLEELTGDEYNKMHTTSAKYKDLYTGYYFVNHFPLGKTLDESYKNTYKTIRRRLDRLQAKIKKGKDFLFVISPIFEMDLSCVQKLNNKLKALYPDKNFDFFILQFNSKKDEEYFLESNIQVKKVQRDGNIYDYGNTNFEWAFLDNVVLKPDKTRLIVCHKIKKGIVINILPFIFTIFRIRVYLFGIRIDFCIGKARD